MARQKGSYTLAGNYEIEKAGALDCRLVVDTIEDLIKKDTWPKSGDIMFLYNGMMVSVTKDGSVWELIDKSKYNATDYSGWRRIDASSSNPVIKGLVDRVELIEVYGVTNASHADEATKATSATYATNASSADKTVGALTIQNNDGTTIQYNGSEDATIKITNNLVQNQNITYSDLVTLRNNKQLIPGTVYRITDYQTTINGSQTEVAVSTHKFDILVEALSESELNQDCKVCLPNTPEWLYLPTDKLHYEATYSINSASWKTPSNISDVPNEILEVYKKEYTSEASVSNIRYLEFKNHQFKASYGLEFATTYNRGSHKLNILGVALYRDDVGVVTGHYQYDIVGGARKNDVRIVEIPKIADQQFHVRYYIALNMAGDTIIPEIAFKVTSRKRYFGDNDLSEWNIKYDIDNNTSKYNWVNATNGKGVIYYMKDEYNNEACYDFKNITFKHNNSWYYTFSQFVNGSVYDGTVITNYCFENSIAGCYDSTGVQKLNHIVFKNTFDIQDLTNNNQIYNCSFNKFSGYCQYNYFGSGCSSNTFGDYCQYINMGNFCGHNKYDNYCQYITLGDFCQLNTFNYSAHYIDVGSCIRKCSFGKNCRCQLVDINGNKLNACQLIEFGDDCSFKMICSPTPYFYTNSDNTSITQASFLQNIKVNNLLNNYNGEGYKIQGLDTKYLRIITSNSLGNIVEYIDGETEINNRVISNSYISIQNPKNGDTYCNKNGSCSIHMDSVKDFAEEGKHKSFKILMENPVMFDWVYSYEDAQLIFENDDMLMIEDGINMITNTAAMGIYEIFVDNYGDNTYYIKYKQYPLKKVEDSTLLLSGKNVSAQDTSITIKTVYGVHEVDDANQLLVIG